MCILTWQSSRWVSGRMVNDRITPHHNANQGWCIVAGTNLKVWSWRGNLGKLRRVINCVKHHAITARLLLLLFSAHFRATVSWSLRATLSVHCGRLPIPYLEQIYDIPPNCILPSASRLSHRPSSSKTSYQEFSSCSTSQTLAQCNVKRWSEYLIIIKHIACDALHNSQPSEAQKLTKVNRPIHCQHTVSPLQRRNW